MSDSEMENIESHFEQLFARESNAQDLCLRRSGLRVAQEIRRLAKSEHRLINYMQACFRIMVNSSSIFDAAAGRDASIELIRLLESPDEARRIEPTSPKPITITRSVG